MSATSPVAKDDLPGFRGEIAGRLLSVDFCAESLARRYPNRFTEEQLRDNAAFYALLSLATLRGGSLDPFAKSRALRAPIFRDLLEELPAKSSELADALLAFHLVNDEDRGYAPTFLQRFYQITGAAAGAFLGLALLFGVAMATRRVGRVDWLAWTASIHLPLLALAFLHAGGVAKRVAGAWRFGAAAEEAVVAASRLPEDAVARIGRETQRAAEGCAKGIGGFVVIGLLWLIAALAGTRRANWTSSPGSGRRIPLDGSWPCWLWGSRGTRFTAERNTPKP